jgi:hypothetical protein
MKSHSVSGPIGWPGSERHAGIDVLGAGETLLEHPHRRHQIRHEQQVDHEAGAVLGADRLLADRLHELLRPRHDARALEHRGVGFVLKDLIAALRCALGDARSHEACADDSDLPGHGGLLP